NMSTVTLPPGTTTFRSFEADGNDYIFAGISQSLGSLPVMSFITGSLNFPDSVIVGTAPSSSPAYGEITQGPFSYVQILDGMQATNGTLTIDQKVGARMVLDGNSQIGDGGTIDVSSNGTGTFTLNGTITLNPLGSNLLDLQNEYLNGHGTVVQQGENDTTQVGRVASGTTFELTGGTLAIEKPLSFRGTIGPLGSPGNAAIGIFGEVAVYNALDTVRATFDTSTDVLSLLDSCGRDLGNFHLSGDVSGVHLTKFSEPAFNYIAMNDSGNSGIGVGGNIPISVIT
ncbi:MAG: hypothetical protein P4L90_14035, partial [Rhodopila sp.]|nr:hypothetical protein [Rhodopila sp.]